MKTKTNRSKTGKSILLSLYEGFSTYTITLPMPYAVRFFAEELLTSLTMLTEVEELKSNFKEKDGEKHNENDLWDRARLLKLNPDEWESLCQKHHRYTHWAMRRLYVSWEDIASAFRGV
ncbi:MAG: hypothetical protein ACXADC_04215 [Candidatus Thorarchaeota archaeon]|jgi:hypothetical protein